MSKFWPTIVAKKVVFDANGADVVGKSVMVQCFVIKLAQCFRSRRPGFYTKTCSNINTNCQRITFLRRVSFFLMRESDLLLRFRTSSPHQNLLTLFLAQGMVGGQDKSRR